jgi:signal transduction histidine kinase
LREVIANLVANALRYTPRGGRIDVAAASAEGAVTIQVKDTGTGIPAEELPRIFDRFATGDDSRGSGLGLAIASRLTEAHGGSIIAASVPDAGTTMIVRLPRGDAS